MAESGFNSAWAASDSTLLTTKIHCSPAISAECPTNWEMYMAPHSSTLAWKIPWTEEPVRLQSMGSLWRRQWHPTPVFLPGKSHGWMSLVGCSPWGHFHFSLSCIGEGNGNPLQCFCLENPRDGGAWWAAICGVTQSRTRLK